MYIRLEDKNPKSVTLIEDILYISEINTLTKIVTINKTTQETYKYFIENNIITIGQETESPVYTSIKIQ